MKAEALQSNEQELLSIPIKIHWSLPALLIFIHVLVGALFLSIALGISQPNPPGSEWVAAGVFVVVLGGVDLLAVPMLVNHYVRFEENHLSIVLGVHRVRVAYADINSVSSNLGGFVAYAWRPTAPDAVRVRGRAIDEALSVVNEELFCSELLKRNPRIKFEGTLAQKINGSTVDV